MKYCLSSRLGWDYLSEADEIKISYKDCKHIFELTTKYPDAMIILDMKNEQIIIDWEQMKKYNVLTKGNFCIGLNRLNDVQSCLEYGIKFYWTYPVSSFYELQGLKDLGVSYALIDAPLTHDLAAAAAVGVPLRMVPNVAYYAFIPRKDGVCGSWVRPEDVELYDNYIYVMEFEDCDKDKEQALFRIYGRQEGWSGDLGAIITNLNYLGVNRMIPRELTEQRIQCQQKCSKPGNHCKLCYRYLDLANPALLQSYKKEVIDNN